VFVALLIAMQVAALTLFFVLARYRVPALPALLLAALSALHFIRDAVRTRDVQRLVTSAGALLIALPIVFWPKLPKAFDDEWFKLGYAYHVEGDVEQAEQAYLRALAINAGNISAHKNLAAIYTASAAPDRARAHWQAVWKLAERRKLPAYMQQAEQALDALP
jgi:tetratricopeptide (TPR) repeat protein